MFYRKPFARFITELCRSNPKLFWACMWSAQRWWLYYTAAPVITLCRFNHLRDLEVRRVNYTAGQLFTQMCQTYPVKFTLRILVFSYPSLMKLSRTFLSKPIWRSKQAVWTQAGVVMAMKTRQWMNLLLKVQKVLQLIRWNLQGICQCCNELGILIDEVWNIHFHLSFHDNHAEYVQCNV